MFLSWATAIQSIPPDITSWRSILILSSHLCLGLPSGLFPSRLLTETLNTSPVKIIQIPLIGNDATTQCTFYSAEHEAVLFFIVGNTRKLLFFLNKFYNDFTAVMVWICFLVRIIANVNVYVTASWHQRINATFLRGPLYQEGQNATQQSCRREPAPTRFNCDLFNDAVGNVMKLKGWSRKRACPSSKPGTCWSGKGH